MPGEIDRKKLGELVFNDPALRKKLNAATHPLVTLELAAQILWHWLMFHFVVVRIHKTAVSIHLTAHL